MTQGLRAVQRKATPAYAADNFADNFAFVNAHPPVAAAAGLFPDEHPLSWLAAGTPVQRLGTEATHDSDAVRAAAAHGTSGAAGPLPHLDRIQPLFGEHDVSGVRAHTDGAAAAGARAMGAEAFAVGDAVGFGATPTLHTAAHEAAHVVQQRGGVHLAGGVGAAGDPYERHADRVADTVVRGESAAALLDEAAGARTSGGAPAVQRQHRPAAPAAPSEPPAGDHAAPAPAAPADDGPDDGPPQAQAAVAQATAAMARIPAEDISWLQDPERRAAMARIYPLRGQMVRAAIGILRKIVFWRLPEEQRHARVREIMRERVDELQRAPGTNHREEILPAAPAAPVHPPHGQPAGHQPGPVGGPAPVPLAGARLAQVMGVRARQRTEISTLLDRTEHGRPGPERQAWRALSSQAAELLEHDVNETIESGETELRSLLQQVGIEAGDWRRDMALSYLGVRYQSAHSTYAPPRRLLRVMWESFRAPGDAPRVGTPEHQYITHFYETLPDADARARLEALHQGGALESPRAPPSAHARHPAPTTPFPAATIAPIPEAAWNQIRRLAQLDAHEGTSDHVQGDGAAIPAPWDQIVRTWRGGTTTAWLGAVQRDADTIQLDRVVCNQLAEIGQAHRDIHLPGGITGDARFYQQVTAQSIQASGQSAAFFRPANQSTHGIPGGSNLFIINGQWVPERPASWSIVRVPPGTALPALREPDVPGATPATPGAHPPPQPVAPPGGAAGWTVRNDDLGVRRERPGSGTAPERQWMRWAHEATILLEAPEAGGYLVLETTDQSSRGGGAAAGTGLTFWTYARLGSPAIMVGYAPEGSAVAAGRHAPPVAPAPPAPPAGGPAAT